MFGHPILMRCGHLADTMVDVSYHNEMITVAGCSYCFSPFQSVSQPACHMAEKQPEYVPPKKSWFQKLLYR